MLKSLVNVLKRIVTIGAQTVPAIVTAYDPPVGALVSTVFNAIALAQGTNPGGNTDAKKTAALTAVQVAMPQIEAAFTGSGKVIHDVDLFATAVGNLHDALLDILNATGAKASA